MSRWTYIAALMYLPLTVFFVLFAPEEETAFDKLYFVTEKGLLCVVLIALATSEVKRNRKIILRSIAFYNFIYLCYMIIDWNDAYRVGLVGAGIASLIIIFIIIYNIYWHD